MKLDTKNEGCLLRYIFYFRVFKFHFFVYRCCSKSIYWSIAVGIKTYYRRIVGSICWIKTRLCQTCFEKYQINFLKLQMLPFYCYYYLHIHQSNHINNDCIYKFTYLNNYMTLKLSSSCTFWKVWAKINSLAFSLLLLLLAPKKNVFNLEKKDESKLFVCIFD